VGNVLFRPFIKPQSPSLDQTADHRQFPQRHNIPLTAREDRGHILQQLVPARPKPARRGHGAGGGTDEPRRRGRGRLGPALPTGLDEQHPVLRRPASVRTDDRGRAGQAPGEPFGEQALGRDEWGQPEAQVRNHVLRARSLGEDHRWADGGWARWRGIAWAGTWIVVVVVVCLEDGEDDGDRSCDVVVYHGTPGKAFGLEALGRMRQLPLFEQRRFAALCLAEE
jgi:hypothetical protein